MRRPCLVNGGEGAIGVYTIEYLKRKYGLNCFFSFPSFRFIFLCFFFHLYSHFPINSIIRSRNLYPLKTVASAQTLKVIVRSNRSLGYFRVLPVGVCEVLKVCLKENLRNKKVRDA
jgi:hypothetical protein